MISKDTRFEDTSDKDEDEDVGDIVPHRLTERA